jgi:hypothetical protein
VSKNPRAVIENDLDAAYWCAEFDECYNIPNSSYLDADRMDEVVERLQVVLNRLKRP